MNKDIEKVREMTRYLIERLEEGIVNNDFLTSKEDKTFWGDKENALSLLTKLTQILIKIPPIDDEDDSSNQEIINENDMEILKQYVEKCNKLPPAE